MSEKPSKPPFTIIGSPQLTPIPPPRKLGDHGLSLWNRIQNEFRIDDVAGIELRRRPAWRPTEQKRWQLLLTKMANEFTPKQG